MFYLEKRVFIVKRFILLLAAMLFAFGSWRIQGHVNVFQGSVDLIASAMLIVAGTLLHYHPKSYNLVSNIVLVQSLIFVLITTSNMSEYKSSILWAESFVLLAFLLRSSKEGWFWLAITLVSFKILDFFTPLHYESIDVYAFLMNIVFVSILVTWYEQIYEEKLKNTEGLNAELDEKIEARTKALKEAKEEAKEAQYRAEEASRAKSTFLASMSHEIRTPLNAINGFISLLKADEEDAKKTKQLNIIQEASGILTDLISDILDLSKIESGRLELNPSDFEPEKLFIPIIELYQAKAAEKDIKLKYTCSENSKKIATLHSDPLRIRQILNNLLSNAIKFTPNEGHIQVDIRFTKHNLGIRVKDSGIGIDEKNFERIFEAFKQSEKNIENIYGGTGLGLAICKQISKQLGGTLMVSSQLGEGSSFVFSIPITEGKKVKVVKEEKKGIVPEIINAHVLVAEDVRANQMFMSMTLKRHGITCDIANDGEETVLLAKTKNYDLILMDENMPKMNGSEAMKVIRQYEKKSNKRHIPVIALTANALQGDKERLLALGMDGYLSKPINPDELTYQIALKLKQLQ